MKVFSVLALFLAASSAEAVENKVRVVSLMTGVEMQIKEIQYSRILPTAYYDQALSSIPHLYPQFEIIAKRRYGYFRDDRSTSYSIVCYKESAEFPEVTIGGIVVSNRNTWRFNLSVNASQFHDAHYLVLEIISTLPYNNILQPAR